MTWTIRIHRLALGALYRIGRGDAAVVTEAIKRLATNPRPIDSQEIPDRPNIYRIEAAGHAIIYEMIAIERVIYILWIE